MKPMILFLSLFLPLAAHAELKLAPPKDLLAKAAKGRIQCREVILDITQNLPEMRDRKTFEPYFGILEPLQEIATRTKLDEIYPGAVRTLGWRMAAIGTRWFSITRDTSDTIFRAHGWMAEETVVSFQVNIDLELAETTDGKLLRNAVLSIERLMSWAETRWSERGEIRLTYRRLVSDAAAKILREPNLSETEQLQWLGKIVVPGSLGTYLENLQAELFTVTKENSAKLDFVGARLLVIHQRLSQADSSLAPGWLLGQLGELAVELLLRHVSFERNIPELARLLAMLQPRHLQALSQQWATETRLPSDAYATAFLSYSQLLVDALRRNALNREANELTVTLQKIAAALQARQGGIEGTYALTGEDGKTWRFSIVFARENLLYAALADSSGVVFKPYFNVTYDGSSESFLASQREQDIDPGQNHMVRFKVMRDGKIELRDLFARPGSQRMVGAKVETYVDFMKMQSPEPQVIPGTYQGVVRFGGGFSKRMTLVVALFQGYSMARLSDGESLVIDLNIGSRGDNGVLYLTTGKLERTTWIQLRGFVKNGVYRAQTIKGGQGASPEFEMRRISD